MTRLCVINVVGLTRSLLKHAPHLAKLGEARAWKSPLPAVTCTSQATMLTGLPPSKHGVVGNGWLHRETGEVRFWQQSNALMLGTKLYEGFKTAQMFWWFNQGAPVEWYATPKPHYGSDGSKEFDIIDATDCNLTAHHGPFPFFSFWGPHAGLASTQWIARASATVIREEEPELSLVYLPHLDYDYQRFGPGNPDRVREVDECAREVIEAANAIDAKIIAVSEYGLVPVSEPIYINQQLRRTGLLHVRDGPYGEMLDTFSSRAFAVADHQLAHIYVRDHPLNDVRKKVEALPGVECVVEPGELELDHPRAGDLIAIAKPNAWFVYYYWLVDRRAPDFARTVDIHRKPGYDPCELFMTSKPRAAWRLLQKKLGFRYRMDVVPLDPTLVRGSHGLHPAPDDGPVVIGDAPPSDMKDFKEYARDLISS